jgi:hypothetical protein
MRYKSIPFVALLVVAACGDKSETDRDGSPFIPSATVQELMLAVIDPNVDPIWNSISTTISAAGVEEVQPQTEEEWLVLRNHAVTLREAANLLLIRGRKVAFEGASTSIHPVELVPGEIEKLINAKWPDFVENAHGLHAAANLALNAIDAKNIADLEAAGGVIEHACETCHSEFWYPGDARPAH